LSGEFKLEMDSYNQAGTFRGGGFYYSYIT
jgi:hypothetical protein